MRKKTIHKYYIYFTFLSAVSLPVNALPKINIEHSTSVQGIPSVRITNETTLILACYVAIDGYKKKFVLQPFGASRWFSAVSNEYKHTNFSTWCDSLEFYPKYMKYIG